MQQFKLQAAGKKHGADREVDAMKALGVFKLLWKLPSGRR